MLTVAQVATAGVGAIVWPILARRLGPVGFGHFQSAQVVGGLLAYAVYFGLAQYSLWRFAAADASWSVAKHLLWVRAVNFAVACGALLAVAALSIHIGPAAIPMWVLLVVVANLVRQAWPDWILIASGGTWALSLVALTVGLLNVAGILLLVRGAHGLLGASLAYLASCVVGLLMLGAIGRRVANRVTSAPASGWRTEMRGAVPFGVAVIAGQLIAYADVVILTMLGHADDVGIYSAAGRVVLVFQGLAGAVQSVALVGFSRLGAGRLDRGSVDAHRGFALTTVAAGISFSVATCAVVLLSRPLIDVVFGAEYVESSRYLRALVLTLPVDVVGAVALAWLSGHGRARAAAWCLVAGAFLCVVTTAALVPPLGPWGAVIGKLLAVIGVCLGAARCLDRQQRRMTTLWGVVVPAVTGLLVLAVVN